MTRTTEMSLGLLGIFVSTSGVICLWGALMVRIGGHQSGLGTLGFVGVGLIMFGLVLYMVADFHKYKRNEAERNSGAPDTESR